MIIVTNRIIQKENKSFFIGPLSADGRFNSIVRLAKEISDVLKQISSDEKEHPVYWVDERTRERNLKSPESRFFHASGHVLAGVMHASAALLPFSEMRWIEPKTLWAVSGQKNYNQVLKTAGTPDIHAAESFLLREIPEDNLKEFSKKVEIQKASIQKPAVSVPEYHSGLFLDPKGYIGMVIMDARNKTPVRATSTRLSNPPVESILSFIKTSFSNGATCLHLHLPRTHVLSHVAMPEEEDNLAYYLIGVVLAVRAITNYPFNVFIRAASGQQNKNKTAHFRYSVLNKAAYVIRH